MKLKVSSPLVSVDWLVFNLQNEKLVVLDATIQKVGVKENEVVKQQIPKALFFDLKNVFLDKKGIYPNTIPSENRFQEEVRKLGVNQDTCIVVYDDLGVYSSPRVWWLFRLFGFQNVAVLNGGFPEWKETGYIVEKQTSSNLEKGDFTAKFNEEIYKFDYHCNPETNSFYL